MFTATVPGFFYVAAIILVSLQISQFYSPNSPSVNFFRNIFSKKIRIIKDVPLATEPGTSLIILLLVRILQRNLKRATETFLSISHTTNVLPFRFRSNIFIGVRNIKEMLGSVARGTHCVSPYEFTIHYTLVFIQHFVLGLQQQ